MNASLYVEITSNCNLSCTHCYNVSGYHGKNITYEDFVDIIEQTGFVNSVSISGGEPLLHPDFPRMLEYAVAKIKVPIVIITNGLLIDDSFVSWANNHLPNDIVSFQISNDGNSKDVYEAIRGKDKYDDFLRALGFIGELNHQVFFHVTLCKLNYHQVEGFIETALLHGHKKIDFSLVRPLGRAKINTSILPDNSDLQLMQRLLTSIKEEHQQIQISIPEPFYGVCGFKIGKFDRFSFRIDPFLNVYPCQMMSLPCHSLGNLHQTRFDSMLEPENLKRLSSALRHFNPFKCQKCIARSICGKGCPAVEDIFDPELYSVECKYRVASIKDAILNQTSKSSMNCK